MARISMKGPGTVEEIAGILKEKIPECGFTCELVDCASRCGVELMVFEKHYYRAGNSLSLTVMVTSADGLVIVDSIGAGAKAGIFDCTWGAEEDFAFEVNNVLAPLGFTVFDQNVGEKTDLFEDFFAPEPTEESLSIGDIMQKARSAARKEKSDNNPTEFEEAKADEPERVKLGREEKKGLFGRKRNKPDWEY